MTYHFKYLFLLISITTINGKWRYDYTFVEKGNGYFKFHEIPANWRDARLRCQLEGAVLASPYPEAVRDVLMDLMIDKKSCVIFTGIHATFSKGDYHTIDGETLRSAGYDQFSAGEPNNSSTGEYCGSVYRTALFNDAGCEKHYAFICEKNPNSLTSEE